MMPEFARNLFGFGKSSSSSSSLLSQSTKRGSSSTPTPTSSNLPTATNSRAASQSGSGAFVPVGQPTTALSTADTVMTEPAIISRPSSSAGEERTTTPGTPSGESGQAKGKLKVRVVEARNLMTIHGSTPYVVCTLDSSEFISEGPSGAAPEEAGAANGGIAIPSSKSRQSSSLALSKLGETTNRNPRWRDEAQFDVTSESPELDISIYDAAHNEAFLGHVRLAPPLSERAPVDQWFTLAARVAGEHVSGQVRVNIVFERVAQRQYGPADFEVLRLVGKGTFGQVFQVRKRDTQRIYAMKVLSKKAIVQNKEVAHTIGERNILVRTSAAKSAFIVGLKFSFQTPSDLYLVTDYMSGGELFWHLQKEGRFKEDRAKFYIAELIVALEALHDNDIVYRDLKPENVLLDANGHVALCDFGLSKANLVGGRTNTFCGTTEYLAPEVLLDAEGYTKMVDFWSLGVLVFEMCCGWSPFYAKDNQQMYKNIAFGKVKFPKDALSTEGRNFVKGLLNRNPKHRLGSQGDTRELRHHPFFSDIDWELLMQKKIPPPFKPHLTSETDTSNFDPEFTQASTSVLTRALNQSMGSTPLSPGIQANFQGFTYVDSSLEEAYRRSRRERDGDGDLDLYNDKEIQEAASSYYNANRSGGDLMRHLEEKFGRQQHAYHSDYQDDEMMIDDLREDDDYDDHDFTGQKFEL
ncbi:serine/threonine-protein kinase Sch9p [Trichomonascus vanleenenianus]|uniref:serine/threonine protein kinase SCH9 n=1 Tax=Trichomonascus vanleenenianus TaxID=2268995 RepID=UPI003EC98348